MPKKEAIVDYGKFTLTAEHVDYIPALGNLEDGFQVLVYRDEDGDYRRPLLEPSIEIYDAGEMRLLYQGWPEPDGVFRLREDGQPSEIYYTGEAPRMVWYDREGQIDVVSQFKRERLSEFFGCAALYAESEGLPTAKPPTAYEQSIPSPLEATLDIM